MKKLMFSSLIVLILSGFSLQTNAQVIIKVRPKAPKVVVVHKKARPNHIWITGHWKVNRFGKYVWTKGYWVKKRHGSICVSGHWKKVRRGWTWVPGHWRIA